MSNSPTLRVWLTCSGCKSTLRTDIDKTDNAKEWAVNLISPWMRHAICPYCESRKRVRLHVSIDAVQEVLA